jgi:predicted phage terminase large subunit-like protein
MIRQSEAAREILARRRARSGLQDFITYINPNYIVSDFSREVCSELDKFIVDAMAGKRPVLILGAPPQHGKSDIVSRYAPAYFFGLHPDLSVGGLSYGKDLASNMNRDVQRIMMGDEYKRLFPKSSLNKKRAVAVEVEAKRNSETFEIAGTGGVYVSQGVDGPLTGKSLDIGIIDDPIKNAKESLSQTVKNSIWNWYVTVFMTRLSQNSGQIIMATRWSTDDLSGRIIDNNPRARVLAFPAISPEGRPLVPELHSLEKLTEQKAAMSEHFWSAMYQQHPVPIGGNIFKDEWWQYWDHLPLITHRIIFADTAQKKGTQNDYSVFQCWGYTARNQAVLLDQVRDKWEAPELLTAARAFWSKHRDQQGIGTLRSLNIEDKSSGTGLIQTLQREGVPVVPIQRSTDKITRGFDAAPFVSSGNVLLPRSAPWLSDFLVEFAAFPNGKHDDQVDPLCDAVMQIIGAKEEGFFVL